MGEPKPSASLSSLLLARKGAARPAMRRPSMNNAGPGFSVTQDDLGWNDMGYDVDPSPLTPMDHDHEVGGYNSLSNAVPDMKPEVRQQQERIAEQLQVQADVFDAIAPVEEAYQPAVYLAERVASIPVAPSIYVAPVVEVQKAVQRTPQKRSAPGQKAKAAFTLRLDNERHLKLRLACAIGNRSAQVLVTEALDALLANMPELDQLAARVPNR
jgi:hypothetical protein